MRKTNEIYEFKTAAPNIDNKHLQHFHTVGGSRDISIQLWNKVLRKTKKNYKLENTTG